MSANLASSANGGLSPQPSNRETQFAEVAEGLREPPRQQAAGGGRKEFQGEHKDQSKR